MKQKFLKFLIISSAKRGETRYPEKFYDNGKFVLTKKYWPVRMEMNINKIRNELSGIYAKIDDNLRNNGGRDQLLDDLNDMINLITKIKVEIK